MAVEAAVETEAVVKVAVEAVEVEAKRPDVIPYLKILIPHRKIRKISTIRTGIRTNLLLSVPDRKVRNSLLVSDRKIGKFSTIRNNILIPVSIGKIRII